MVRKAGEPSTRNGRPTSPEPYAGAASRGKSPATKTRNGWTVRTEVGSFEFTDRRGLSAPSWPFSPTDVAAPHRHGPSAIVAASLPLSWPLSHRHGVSP